MAKRKSTEGDNEGTPKKARNSPEEEDNATAETPTKQRTVAETPSKQRSILKSAHANLLNREETPKSLRKVLFSTPAKAHGLAEDETIQDSPITAARNADRSARRKSSRKLFQGDDGELDQEDDIGEDITQEILDSDDAGEEGEELLEDEDQETIDVAAAPDTPSKQVKLRGRPKGKRRARSPTPPDDLPPHELYFFQNRPGGVKTSTNTLSSTALLNHDDYFAQINAYKDSHQDDMAILTNMHKASFEQWQFELEEGFNICLYGYGSKRALLLDFADYLYNSSADAKKPPKIVVVNGYNPSLNLRDIFATIANSLLPSSQAQKLPQQPAALLDALLATLSANPPKTPLHLLINSIDAPPLRRHQPLLSILASSPYITLSSTADTPTFPLLWDISLRSAFRFLFHDCTTFAPYTAEIDPVDEVNALLGRSGRRVGGKDGVAYVLRSLPENARSLYRILVAELLALADADPLSLGSTNATGNRHEDYAFDDTDEHLLGQDTDRFDMPPSSFPNNGPDADTPSKRGRGRPPKKPKPVPPPRFEGPTHLGIEYRTLYHKAVEEFVCSSEVSFRTLLKEFHDHDMLESRKDAQGAERLGVPFAREELEEILEELV